MVHFETRYYMITSITTMTTYCPYYITSYYLITTIMPRGTLHPPNLEMFRLAEPASGVTVPPVTVPKAYRK